MSGLKLFLLGPPRLERDGEPLKIEAHKSMALLAYLAVTGPSSEGAHYSRESLVALLWPELEPGRARAGLRRDLSILKKALGGKWLVADRETVSLDSQADIWIDTIQFHHLLQAGQAHGHADTDICPDCLTALAEAVELYRGDFLAGFTLRDSPAFDEWQFFQTEGLRQELAAALERLVRGHSERGAYETAIPFARRWLSLDPLHEPVHRQLMQLYTQAGQYAAAVRQYQECTRILAEELGISPQPETTALYEHLRSSKTDHVDPLFAGSSPAPRHNLPASLTSFVGREAELVRIEEYLQDPGCRLLTLIGSGGIGKTRLALEVAAAQLHRFAHGVFFVPLASLQTIEAIMSAVARAVGFSFYEKEAPQQQLLDYLSQKNMLLLMDNFEHLLMPSADEMKGGAELVVEMLQAAPGLKILATSRAGLNVQGEQLFRLGSMDFPDETITGELVLSLPQDVMRYSAIKLFWQSARRVQSDFELTAGNLPDVVQICRMVQGIPLAIQMAAGWVQILSPAEIADQVSGEIGQRLDLLEADLRNIPERQRSMRAVFDHSWELLTERERKVFQSLSVFRGGFIWEAAREVAGASLRELMTLVNKSLLYSSTPPGRYEMHELLRLYASETLDQSPAASETAHDRHCAYYCAALQRWEADLISARQQTALMEMDVEIENARAAWNWAAERGQVERVDQALTGLVRFHIWRGRNHEGEAACRLAAENLTATTSSDGLRVLAKVLSVRCALNRRLGRIEFCRQLIRQSLTLLEQLESADQRVQLQKGYTLNEMADLAVDSDPEKAKQLYGQSLALFQALGDRWGMAGVLGALGDVAWHLGAYDEAKQSHEESLKIRRALGDQRGVATSLMSLGIIASRQGQLEEAERLVRESVAIHQETGNRGGIADGLACLGGPLLDLGKVAEAHSVMTESAAIYNDLGVRDLLAYSKVVLGLAEKELGRYEQARVQGQIGLALSRQIDYQRGIGLSCYLLGLLAVAEEAYTEAQDLLQESIAACRAAERPFELSLALGGLGYATRGLGDLDQAKQHLHEALRMSAEIGAFFPLVLAIPVAALLLADQGEVERAVELYALVLRYPIVPNSRWFEDVAGKHIAAVAATLPPEVVVAAQARGQARDLWATAAELLAELK
jgi:predicted ATPase/DNA-binding SARP family transcriptional activator